MTITRTTLCGLVLAFATGAGVLLAQGQAPTPQAEPQAPEVFCDGLSPGQLCLSNAPNVLKLDDAQTQRWTEAARQYNKAVDAATRQLLEQSKPVLSPGQFATMQKWFDAGLNPVLNQVLSTQASRK